MGCCCVWTEKFEFTIPTIILLCNVSTTSKMTLFQDSATNANKQSGWGGGVAWKRYKNKEVGISDLADLDGRDPGHRLEWKIHDAVVIPYRIRIRRAASMTQWDQSIRQQKKEQRETTTEPIKLALSTSPWALFAERCRAKRLLPPSLTTSSLIVR